MNKEDLLSYQIRLSLVKVEGFPRDSLQQIEPIEHTKIVEVKKLDDAKEGYRILKGMLKYMNRDNHTLSQKTKASEPDRRAHRMISPTKEFLKNHPCCGCIDWVEEKQECIADPLPEDVNTCFKAKEALYP